MSIGNEKELNHEKKNKEDIDYVDIKMEALIAWNEYQDVVLKDKMRREVVQ